MGQEKQSQNLKKVILIVFLWIPHSMMNAQGLNLPYGQVFDALNIAQLHETLSFEDLSYQEFLKELDSLVVVQNHHYHSFEKISGNFHSDITHETQSNISLYWIRSSIDEEFDMKGFYDDSFEEHIYARVSLESGRSVICLLYSKSFKQSEQNFKKSVSPGIASILLGSRLYQFTYDRIGTDILKKSYIELNSGETWVLNDTERLQRNILLHQVKFGMYSHWSTISSLQVSRLFPLIPWDSFFPGSHSCCVTTFFDKKLSDCESFILEVSMENDGLRVTSLNYSTFEGGQELVNLTNSLVDNTGELIHQKIIW